MMLVHDYIGVEGGCLWRFSYRAHEEFYPRYCNTRIDVARRRRDEGTTRATILAILRDADPQLQAKIVEGIFEYLPLEKFPEESRTNRLLVGFSIVANRGSLSPIPCDLQNRLET